VGGLVWPQIHWHSSFEAVNVKLVAQVEMPRRG
jgi:hypothetical protein